MPKKNDGEKETKAVQKVGAEKIGVYDKYGSLVRAFSAAEHGEGFDKLAEGFATAPKNARFGYVTRKMA